MTKSHKIGAALAAVLVTVFVVVMVTATGNASSEPEPDPDFSCTMAMWDLVYDSWEGSPHHMLTDEQKDLGFDLAIVRNRLMVYEDHSDHQAHMAILPYVTEACDG